MANIERRATAEKVIENMQPDVWYTLQELSEKAQYRKMQVTNLEMACYLKEHVKKGRMERETGLFIVNHTRKHCSRYRKKLVGQ